jgi:hypothetical protein
LRYTAARSSAHRRFSAWARPATELPFDVVAGSGSQVASDQVAAAEQEQLRDATQLERLGDLW